MAIPKSQLEAILTVPPFIVTDPREVRQILVKNPIGSSIFNCCLNIVFYYNKAMEKDSGWVMAGYIKESLGIALKEEPLLSGRLRRGEDGLSELEIVSNDSGVRLVEAKIGMNLQDFLDLKDKNKSEGELIYWKDIDQQNPQFSPLFYVQVTNFQCGGYSVGISCSILLAELVIMDKFLQNWAKIQNEIFSKNEEPKVPIFYLPNLKPPNLSLNGTFNSTPRENCGQTMIFKVNNETLKGEPSKKLALLCVEEAEQNLGTKIPLNEFTFLEKEKESKVIKIENFNKNDEIVKLNMKSEVVKSCASLKDYSGMNELAFREGNKPARVSLWIGSMKDGFVVGIPSTEKGTSELNIIVTLPCET